MMQPQPHVPFGDIRLNRYLAQCGLGARRKCDELIRSGHVFINGKKVTELGTKVMPADRIEYRGKTVTPLARLEYLAYNKPAAVMVTKRDPEGRMTVYEKLRKTGRNADHLNYVGRLDYFSEGLLLMTNDGSLLHALTHPRYHIKKTYRVQLERALSESDAQQLLDGIVSEGQTLHAGGVRAVPGGRDETWYELDLYEGKNRQIRRMLGALHFRIIRLIRIRFACVRLGDLAPGAFRELTTREIAGLKAAGFKPKRGA
ncbi:MAG: rRNA pseudouridine synthase [Chitinispirillaceae bacterium]|nr:rRNA pseudouridine synthase [Chitinispirillaceae bacterium]